MYITVFRVLVTVPWEMLQYGYAQNASCGRTLGMLPWNGYPGNAGIASGNAGITRHWFWPWAVWTQIHNLGFDNSHHRWRIWAESGPGNHSTFHFLTVETSVFCELNYLKKIPYISVFSLATHDQGVNPNIISLCFYSSKIQLEVLRFLFRYYQYLSP